MRRVRVASLPAGPVDDATWHHLAHVLRLAPGVPLVAFDGAGNLQPVTVGDHALIPAGPVEREPEPPAIDLVVSVLKHQPMDLAVRMATEAGVRRILPVIMERTVARGDRHDRWLRIVQAAATQSQRAHEPELLPVQSLRDAVEALDGPIYFGAFGHGPPTHPDGAVVIGPAGGLAPSEEAWLLERATPIGLGPHVLRAETACAVAVSLLASAAARP